MACKGCSPGGSKSGGSCASGCGSGGCGSGGCNRLNSFDWLTARGISDSQAFHLFEVSFKQGAQKEFFIGDNQLLIETGDYVVVDTGGGYDCGIVTLSGDLVRIQMKKKKVTESRIQNQIVRKAHDRDLERMAEARNMEKQSLVKARAIARSLGLDMKLADIQYQADLRKATFFFTADGRVDFRELIRHYAKDFRVKIEMRQIGARQESSRLGGIGSCGRELCCSTWLTDFKSVATTAARYQNLAINQAKLSGQCGRLKCCLNYELDTYIDALKSFPNENIKLKFEQGRALHVKTDIFKGLMYYSYEPERGRPMVVALEKEQVFKLIEMNTQGVFPADPGEMKFSFVDEDQEKDPDFGDVTGGIELPETKRKKKKKKRKPGAGAPRNESTGNGQRPQQTQTSAKPENITGPNPDQGQKKQSRPPRRNKNRRPGNTKPDDNKNQ